MNLHVIHNLRRKEGSMLNLSDGEHPAEQKSRENIVVIGIVTQPYFHLKHKQASKPNTKLNLKKKAETKLQQRRNINLNEIVFGRSVSGRKTTS